MYDIFVPKRSNKQVHERPCTEPKDDLGAGLQIAIAFEEGLRRQRQLANQVRRPK